MIQASLHSLQRKAWQSELARAVSDPAELFELLQLPLEALPASRSACSGFPLRVPHSYISRIQPGRLDDPLLLQVLPSAAEQIDKPGFRQDPVGDLQSMPVPGLLHKYAGRALLVTTGACGVNCRYCFRRHFPYSNANPASSGWQAALDYLRRDKSIREVILSGGDPLSLNDRRLQALASELGSIPHLQRLRIHTRLPVVLPSRVDTDLCKWLEESRLKTVVVLHINHAQEFDPDFEDSCQRLLATGSMLLNQSVLLRGVNDSVDSLVDLSESLFRNGVMPYYLHQLDPVQGASHFEVERNTARQLHDELRNRLPGYLVPKLVEEIAGKASKLPL